MPWRTMFLTVTTCFLAGSTFAHWIADHNTVWMNPTTEDAVRTAITYYKILAGSSSPEVHGDATLLQNIWLFMGIAATVMCGSRAINGMTDIQKEDNESNGGYLFDGACTVLLLRVVWVQWSEIYPAINGLYYDTAKLASDRATFEEVADVVRGIASRNLSISVSLTGVILLQAGRYYSERSYEKSRIAAEAEELLRKTTPLGIDETTMSSAVTSDNEDDQLHQGTDTLRKRGRAQTPYRELSEEAAMDFNPQQESAL